MRGLQRYGPGLLGIGLGLLLWQWGHQIYGGFILPSPLQTLQAIGDILLTPASWALIGATLWRVALAASLSLSIGGLLGVVAGYVPFILRMLQPWAVVLLGMPAIAWIVLTMLWFGPSHGAVVFTIVVVTLPVVFMGTAAGVISRDRRLEAMAAAFGAGVWRQFYAVALRQITAQLAPVLAIASALSFKVAIMAELLTNVSGIGGALARARANLAVDEALAWIALAVLALLLVEYAALQPLRHRLERWRQLSASA